MDWWICRTCAVESALRPDVCPVCADERQWVPAAGQQWTTLARLQAEGHRVAVRELEPDLFALTVSPGVGIAQEELPLVFDRFYRSSSARADQISGTGLGLDIVRTIVEAHDGTISVRSALGEGTTFLVCLPAG